MCHHIVLLHSVFDHSCFGAEFLFNVQGAASFYVVYYVTGLVDQWGKPGSRVAPVGASGVHV